MQIYARDENNELTISLKARKHKDYFCTHCKAPVRLRSGFHLRPHFYHFTEKKCPLSQKSTLHIEIQHQLKALIPSLVLEKSFSAINRIADSVWEDEKIIFEVQISPISAEEVNARMRDYHSQGYEVVWILHEKQFNHFKVSGAEHVLRGRPHYFTNFNKQGAGWIYDQFSWISRGLRKERLKKRAVDLTSLRRPISDPNRQWTFGFKGDYTEALSEEDRNVVQNWKEAAPFPYDWKVVFRLLHDYFLRQACR